jgi:hypothetical protein
MLNVGHWTLDAGEKTSPASSIRQLFRNFPLFLTKSACSPFTFI